MKKKVLLSVSILLLSTLILSLISSAGTTNSTASNTTSSGSSTVGIDAKAKACLESQLGTCSNVSLEDKIFGTLAGVKSCSAPLISASQNTGECWPNGNCNINQTSQAILALGKSSTTKAQSWLESKTIPAKGLEWYIQIETTEASTCTISYSGESHTLQINEDKTLSRGAGSCLGLDGDYSLKVANRNECYNNSFSISCDQPFLVTKMYKPLEGQTIYLSEKTSSGSPGATVTEKIDAACFSLGSSCNYKDSLWATLALDSSGRNISRFIPYLVVFADQPENAKYFPSVFLYIFTNSGEYREKIISQQKEVSGQHYWDVSGYRYYDSALAMLPFQSETPQEKVNIISWLTKVQGPEGCWNSKSIRDTAFLLHSVFGAKFASPNTGGLPSCQSPNYCLTASQCTEVEGLKVEGYSCSIGAVCCNKNLPTCAEKQGVFCKTGEYCKEGDDYAISDSSSGLCCINGTCEKSPEQQETPETCITDEIGSCKNACEDGEARSYEGACNSPKVCCVEETKSSNSILIVILILLIVLAALGIVFKDKLKVLLIKLKSKKSLQGIPKDSKQMPSRGVFSPANSRPSYNPNPGASGMPLQRRVIPPARGAPTQPVPRNPIQPDPRLQRRLVRQATNPELEEVLKKLKDMGK